MRAAQVATAMRKKSYRKIRAKRGFSVNRACSGEFDPSTLAVTRGLDLWVNLICGSFSSLSPKGGEGGGLQRELTLAGK
jgi:hypothetical protein